MAEREVDEERRPLLTKTTSTSTSTSISTTCINSNPSSTTTTTSKRDIRQSASFQANSLRRYSSASYLPPYHEEHDSPSEDDPPSSALAIWTVVPVSLLGVFVANFDGSLVVASSQQIASEFNALSSATWLVTAFILAQCASQPLYGKLSDIFGRRSNLSVAYLFFAGGCFLCGSGQTYGAVLSGRAISGVGGAGMTALVSIIIADMVPVREIATWRSYVNIAATLGRALGGPLGGWVCDALGWRWAFYVQVPITLLGLLLIIWRLPTKVAKPPSKLPDQEDAIDENNSNENEDVKEETLRQKIARVDFLGALTIAITITSFLLILQFSAQQPLPRLPLLILSLLLLASGILSYYIERRFAKEPILPMSLLLSRPALTSYLLSGLQIAAQFAVFYSTPLYFQITTSATIAASGLHLVPAVVGNALAGLLAGYLISRSGSYKRLTIASNAFGCVGYTLITLRWRGATSWLETLYIFCGGFAAGANQSTTFVHLAASLPASDMAIAGTMLYLFQSLFMLIGIQLSTTVVGIGLAGKLEGRLEGVPHKKEVIKAALSSVKYVLELPEALKGKVVGAYVESLTNTFAMALGFAVLGLLVACTLRERKL